MTPALRCWVLALALAGCSRSDGGGDGDGEGDVPDAVDSDAGSARVVKVMIINMFFLEGGPFIGSLGLTEDVPVPGLPASAPAVHCNADDVCQVTTGMGYANAASSVTALLYRSGLDLTHAYFIIAGIAGVDPTQGTLGSAAWARYVVDYGLANEIDAREMPAGWPYGYFAIGGATPADPPAAGSAAFQLDESLLQAAYSLSRDVALDDSADAAAARARYAYAPANQPPTVLRCDISSSDTWFAGIALNRRARDWMGLATGGAGVACMSAQEDSATLEVLRRGAAAGAIDMSRVAALRTGSDFSQPFEGQTDADQLVNSLEEGGLFPAVNNLAKVATPVIQAIVGDWSRWREGVPADLPPAS